MRVNNVFLTTPARVSPCSIASPDVTFGPLPSRSPRNSRQLERAARSVSDTGAKHFSPTNGRPLCTTAPRQRTRTERHIPLKGLASDCLARAGASTPALPSCRFTSAHHDLMQTRLSHQRYVRWADPADCARWGPKTPSRKPLSTKSLDLEPGEQAAGLGIALSRKAPSGRSELQRRRDARVRMASQTTRSAAQTRGQMPGKHCR